MFKRKREYFVVWIVDYNGYISYGSHYITSTYRGLKLLNYLISTNKKEVIYQTDDLNTYNLLIELGFKKIEENINMEF